MTTSNIQNSPPVLYCAGLSEHFALATEVQFVRYAAQTLFPFLPPTPDCYRLRSSFQVFPMEYNSVLNFQTF